MRSLGFIGILGLSLHQIFSQVVDDVIGFIEGLAIDEEAGDLALTALFHELLLELGLLDDVAILDVPDVIVFDEGHHLLAEGT